MDVGTSLSLFLRYTPRGIEGEKKQRGGVRGERGKLFLLLSFSSQSSFSCERECGMFSSSELLLSWGTALLCPFLFSFFFFHLPWGPLVNAVGTLPPSPLPSSSGWNPTLETEVNQCSRSLKTVLGSTYCEVKPEINFKSKWQTVEKR